MCEILLFGINLHLSNALCVAEFVMTRPIGPLMQMSLLCLGGVTFQPVLRKTRKKIDAKNSIVDVKSESSRLHFRICHLSIDTSVRNRASVIRSRPAAIPGNKKYLDLCKSC